MHSVSDLLHAMHAATGVDVPCNEEWYHYPPSARIPMRFRILLRRRISTLAGFEGGTCICFNTTDPWDVVDRLVSRPLETREAGTTTPMKIGKEYRVSPEMLSD